MKHAEYRTKSEKNGRLFLRRSFFFHFVRVYVIIKKSFFVSTFLDKYTVPEDPGFLGLDFRQIYRIEFVKSIGLDLQNQSDCAILLYG